MRQDYQEVLSTIEDIENGYVISIIQLSAPIGAERPGDESIDSSGSLDSSSQANGNLTPADLENDLADYKELFSKLRFSYQEQVTKEKFLQAIIGDQPLIVEQSDIVALEGQLVVAKEALQAQKVEVEDLVQQLERRGRELSERYESVQLQIAQAKELPDMIEELEKSIAELRSPYSAETDRSQSLSLPATLSLVEQRQAELADLDRQLASLESTSARKGMEVERLQTENRQLEQQKLLSTRAAEEAQRRKAGLDSDGNDLERRGRWWKGVGEGLGELLELEG